MKKNTLLLMFLLSVITADVQAQEWWAQDFYSNEDNCCTDETNFYAKLLAGANFLQNTTIDKNKSTYQAGYLIGGSLGYCWCYGLRIEAEYAYRRNAINKIDLFGADSSKHGHYQDSSYMANLLWDLPLPSLECASGNIRSFVGAGAGYDFQQMHASNSRVVFNQKWNQFSWQIIAGLQYPIFSNTDLTLEYKFHQGGTHFYNHFVGMGLVYKREF